MTETRTTAAPAILRAIGGWEHAPWFSPNLLSDHKALAKALSTATGAGIWGLVIQKMHRLEAIRAVNLRKFFLPQFWEKIIVYIPDEHIYALRYRAIFSIGNPHLLVIHTPLQMWSMRRANWLRVEARLGGMRLCVLDVSNDAASLLFWHEADEQTTNQLVESIPLLPIRVLQAEPKKRSRRPSGDFKEPTSDPGFNSSQEPEPEPVKYYEVERMKVERDALIGYIALLRAQLENRNASYSTQDAMKHLGLDDLKLKQMLRLLHPDRHGNSVAANDATKWINNLRDTLKNTRSG